MSEIRPKRKPGVVARQVGNETMLYTDTDAIYVLNQSAKQIWELCDGHHSLSTMARTLQERFEIPAGHDVVADIRDLLIDLSTKELLQISLE